MKVIQLRPTSEPNWWVGEVHSCRYYLCRTIFQLEENDQPKYRFSSGDKQHSPAENVWSVKCPKCGAETDIRAEEA